MHLRLYDRCCRIIRKLPGKRLITKKPLYFGKQVGLDVKAKLLHVLGMQISEGDGRYSGLPFLVGRSPKQVFLLHQRACMEKLNGWKENFLSQAGKEVLIKSFLQVIPTYSMQCFLLPRRLKCDETMRMIRKFW